MNKNAKRIILRMSLVAIFSALSYVLAAFLTISYAGGAGYFNFGDIISILVAMGLGPIEGMIVGMLAGSMADLTAGAAYFVPFTLLAKGSMCLLTGLLFKYWKKKKISFLAPIIGALPGILFYIPAYIIYFGSSSLIASVPFDCIQCFSASFISLALYHMLNKAKVFDIVKA